MLIFHRWLLASWLHPAPKSCLVAAADVTFASESWLMHRILRLRALCWGELTPNGFSGSGFLGTASYARVFFSAAAKANFFASSFGSSNAAYERGLFSWKPQSPILSRWHLAQAPRPTFEACPPAGHYPNSWPKHPGHHHHFFPVILGQAPHPTFEAYFPAGHDR